MLIEVLAWLPFGLLFLALIDRSSGPDEMARLLGEMSADVNTAKNTTPEGSNTQERKPPDQVVAMVAVRGQQSRRSRSRQTLPEWICM